MANIVTVFVRLQLRKGWEDIRETRVVRRRLPEPKGLRGRLHRWLYKSLLTEVWDEPLPVVVRQALDRAGTYNVPLFSKLHPALGCLDLQYGGKWSFHETVDAFAPYCDSIWMRTSDEGRPPDRIHRLRNGAWEDLGTCRYGFDEVRIDWLPGREPEPGVGWIHRWNQWSDASLRGSYAAENSRSFGGVLDGQDKLTPSTPAGAACAAEGVLPVRVSDLQTTLFRSARRVEYRWKGRLVHLDERDTEAMERRDAMEPDMRECAEMDPTWYPSEEWSHYGLDDWDNCVQEDFRKSMGLGL